MSQLEFSTSIKNFVNIINFYRKMQVAPKSFYYLTEGETILAVSIKSDVFELKNATL